VLIPFLTVVLTAGAGDFVADAPAVEFFFTPAGALYGAGGVYEFVVFVYAF